MDFSLSPELAGLRKQVRAFVDERVIPVEAKVLAEDRERRYDTLVALQQEAKAAGLFTPHLPPEYGGRGLGPMGMCVLFREMGRSPVGARVFHCDAPDQGNMDLLLGHGSPEQKARFLVPLTAGAITSAFCMTEPAPGAGADPSNLRSTAVADGDGFVLDAHKWYTTGGGDAAFYLVLARTDQGLGKGSGGGAAVDKRGAATLFLVERERPGVRHVRDFGTMAEPYLAHREAEMRFEGVRLGPESVVGGVGQGFRLAQARLVPARLTHCMRWLGLADRALAMCRGQLATRRSFGRLLGEHQLLQKMIADDAAAIHAGNLMTFHCAWLLERGAGKEARAYSSMTKTHVARLLCKVLDDAIQMHGGLGYSDDLPLATWYRQARAARIADGPDEVHEMVVAREFLAGTLDLLV